MERVQRTARKVVRGLEAKTMKNLELCVIILNKRRLRKGIIAVFQ